MYSYVRRRTYHLLTPEEGGKFGYYVDAAIIALICLNVVMVVLETVDGLRASYGELFYWFETLSVAIFTAEYLGRLWTSVEDGAGPAVGRLRFATKPMLLVDLVAIAPFYMKKQGVLTRRSHGERVDLEFCQDPVPLGLSELLPHRHEGRQTLVQNRQQYYSDYFQQ
ncbi:ion transporter [Haloplanus salilacus]|uniref:ion transporter n=1 Tax=Haloplanus salilacus TaxID=2949994 RepID=UPI0030CF996C